MGILSLIASRNYIATNKNLIKLFGLDEAIILGELASQYDYWETKNELDTDGFFYSTIENIEEATTIKEKRQRNALNNLKRQGVINIKLKGCPAKRFIKINEEKLFELFIGNKFSQNDLCSSAKMTELDEPKPPTNNNISNKNKINNNIIAEQIITYLNEKAGTHYKPVDSNLKYINARLKDYTEADLKAVIDTKVKEWKGTKMQQYIRPETLFNATKFESYLNGLETVKEKKSNFTQREYSKSDFKEMYTNIEDIEI